MTDTEALMFLIVWLAAVVVLAIACALMVLRLALEDRPAGQLKTREILAPLWCALAGDRETRALQAILERRLAQQQLASCTLRDVARHRAGKQPYEPRHRRPRAGGWLSELDDTYLLDRGSPYSWMTFRRWPPYL